MTPNILKKHDAYTFEYPKAIEFAEAQEDVFWMAKEVVLEKDLHDLKNTLTESEYHGVVTTLRLFTQYELKVGADFWLGRMMRIFKRPELQRMFSVFGSFELNVHAPFYGKINELLGLNTEEFYLDYVNQPELKERIDSIDAIVGLKITDELDILKSIGAFSIVEGAILYSNFAFLKHFQAEGKNKLANLVAGIDFSVRDEHIHSQAGAWIFNQLHDELGLGVKDRNNISSFLYQFCDEVLGHEEKISQMVFEKGPIVGITDHQLDNFVMSRLNTCLSQLGHEPVYEVTYNPIAHWFYKSLKSNKLHDFFATQGNAYHRDWKESEFIW